MSEPLPRETRRALLRFTRELCQELHAAALQATDKAIEALDRQAPPEEVAPLATAAETAGYRLWAAGELFGRIIEHTRPTP